jgi:hypothetical protein
VVKDEGERRGDLINQLAGYVCQLDSVGGWGLIDLLLEMEAVNHIEAWWLMSERMTQEAD